MIGAGMAVLQVVVNPLLRVAGGEEHYAFYSTLSQLVFGSASFISPRIYSYLVLNLSKPAGNENGLLSTLRRLTPDNLPWVSIYWIFTASSFVMVIWLLLSKFPKVERTEDERAGSWDMYLSLARKRVVWLYFLAMFAYIGCEQGTADWISKFLYTYHGFDPQTTGADAVSWFWGLLTAGCVVGMLLLKFIDSRKVLIGGAVGSLICLTAALFGPGESFAACVSRSRIIYVSALADHHFSRLEFRDRTSRLVLRHSQHRADGRSNHPSHHRENRRSRRTAQRHGISLRDVWICAQRGILGTAADYECDDWRC